MNEPYPIPVKINIIIIVSCTAIYFTLLYAAAHTSLIGLKLVYGLAFAIILIPVYSLMHEAVHHTLHPIAGWNTFLGRWLCCLFIISFSFFRHCHFKHHKKNRTDEEMWDLYYEHQNKWLRYGNLYIMMIGFGYLAIWLSVILFALVPRLVNSSLFKKHLEINGFLEGSNEAHKIKTEQFESISVILFQFILLWILHWNLSSWLILYMIHGFVWSSKNYVNHAFSPRDIIKGAHNLNVPVWMNLIFLHFNVHLVHHQHPQIPWIHLPKLIGSQKGHISFFKNYLQLWKGPKLTQETSPKPLPNKD